MTRPLEPPPPRVSPEPPARRFCRFRDDAENDPGLSRLPADGLCLSAFLLLRQWSGSSSMLWGRADPSAGWGRIGALDGTRVGRVRDRWMLPSCHLQLFEAPLDAARRIAREQLELPEPELGPARVFSEAYRRGDDPKGDPHWDLHFVFESVWPTGRALRASAWTELRFARPEDLGVQRIARGHQDIVALVGGAENPSRGPSD